MVSAKAVRQALYQQLNVGTITANLANGSASIHHSAAPSSGAYPMIVFNRQASTTTHTYAGGVAGTALDTAYETDVWLVKAIAKGNSSSVAEDVDQIVSRQLNFGTLNVTGADDLYMARESSIEYSEVVDGEVYRHHGHLYRLMYEDS